MTDVQRSTAVIIDLAFKAAVTIGLGIGGWLFTRIESHESRLITIEARVTANAEASGDRFKRMFEEVDKLNHKVDQLLGWTRARDERQTQE